MIMDIISFLGEHYEQIDEERHVYTEYTNNSHIILNNAIVEAYTNMDSIVALSNDTTGEEDIPTLIKSLTPHMAENTKFLPRLQAWAQLKQDTAFEDLEQEDKEIIREFIDHTSRYIMLANTQASNLEIDIKYIGLQLSLSPSSVVEVFTTSLQFLDIEIEGDETGDETGAGEIEEKYMGLYLLLNESMPSYLYINNDMLEKIAEILTMMDMSINPDDSDADNELYLSIAKSVLEAPP